MVWFRVDDSFLRSAKLMSIPRRRRAQAAGAWLLAGAWAAGELTDGFVPFNVLDELPSARRCIPDLVSANLWCLLDDGISFHDWQDYQPTRAEVLAKRAENAARQKAYRERRQAERDAARNASQTPSVTTPRPDPTRPDPTSSSFGTTTREKTRASARAPNPPESTGMKRARQIALAVDQIKAAQGNGTSTNPEIGPT